ncbi:hypothetical protein TNCV_4054211 [Trichonephila clavipes]|nr:hypothetical protein TNCV_4054211 [Trichonephila clavipes]
MAACDDRRSCTPSTLNSTWGPKPDLQWGPNILRYPAGHRPVLGLFVRLNTSATFMALRSDILEDVDTRLLKSIDRLVMDLELKQRKPQNGLSEKTSQSK